MEKRIYYLGYYDVPENKSENRNVVLSAATKMSYVITALEALGYSVTVLSASHTKNKRGYKKKSIAIGKRSLLLLPRSLPSGGKLRRIISILYQRVRLALDMIRHLGKGDALLVYHSLAYARLVRWLKKIKGFRLILEMEELYADVNGRRRDRKKEERLAKAADAYLFPTELLNERINKTHKPYAIAHGTYRAEEERVTKGDYRARMGWDPHRIHLVYAGTLDPRKGGALAAAACAAFLNENYHLHLLGFGSETEIRAIKSTLAEAESRSGCRATFDGLLAGEDYLSFLQGCDVGLSTQNPAAAFNDTSFPSKILSYMANGLRVVSIRIPAVETSAVSRALCYYDTQEPQALAEAILSIDWQAPYDARALLQRLDTTFTEELKKLMETIQ